MIADWVAKLGKTGSLSATPSPPPLWLYVRARGLLNTDGAPHSFLNTLRPLGGTLLKKCYKISVVNLDTVNRSMYEPVGRYRYLPHLFSKCALQVFT